MTDRFMGLTAPTTDFAKVRSKLVTQPLYFKVDLSAARSLATFTALTVPIVGNILYIDQAPNQGFATLHFQDELGFSAQPTPLTVYPGFVGRFPFTQVQIENTSQPGQSLNIIYGVDLDFNPSSAAGVTVINAVNVQDTIAANCQMIAPNLPSGTGANQVSVVLAPAANPNGFVIRNATLNLQAGGGGSIVALLVAAAQAPTNFNSQAGQMVILHGYSATTTQETSRTNMMQRRIPGGWGIWEIATIVTAAAGSNGVYLSGEAL